MKKITLIILILSFVGVKAQESLNVQQQINQEVWRSFKKAFETLNAEDLNALYADEVLRVTPQGIDTKNKFKEQNLERFNINKANGNRILLDFWFDSRHTNNDTSYEVGFYRIKFLNKSEESIVYGQFHIVLKKIQGKWKITQDWDTTIINGEEITAKDFSKQPPLKFN
ncbi:DUF4440 domain-containing protein [Flavobacteriaceae bacterium R38]|nr:DUF4440 domain-containing protein [Flavobacteriaceae bacterium R38]